MRVPVHAGDLVSIQTGGGGGWGDPLERDPMQVSSDVFAGYVSMDASQREYGVVLDPASLRVDEAATQAMRAKLRSDRTRSA